MWDCLQFRNRKYERVSVIAMETSDHIILFDTFIQEGSHMLISSLLSNIYSMYTFMYSKQFVAWPINQPVL
jgi:hypothetical protein